MFGTRRLVSLLLVLGAVALAVPAATLASGGGSAGDNQYTDPFAHTTSTASAPATTSTAAAPQTTTTAAPVTSTPAPVTTTPAAPAATATAVPTATADATTAPVTNGSVSRSLPYTGYDSLLAGALGVALLAAGIGLRSTARRA
jgi:hypothetical protein